VGRQMDEAQFEAKITRLLSMQQRGLLSAEEVADGKTKLLAAFAPCETSTGLPAIPATLTVGALFGGGMMNGAVPPQLQPQLPQLQLAMAPAVGPTAQQLAAQQQLDVLQQQQAVQLEQMQQQMQEQMAAAQAAVSVAAPAPVAAPHVQFREQVTPATRSTSSGEKPAAPAAALAVVVPKKASEKQSTDLDSKAKSGSGGTEKRAIVVMFCDICDSTAMSEEVRISAQSSAAPPAATDFRPAYSWTRRTCARWCSCTRPSWARCW